MPATTKYNAKRNEITCYCAGVKFPHRLESLKACRDFYNDELLTEDYRAGVMRDFDRTEASAINRQMGVAK